MKVLGSLLLVFCSIQLAHAQYNFTGFDVRANGAYIEKTFRLYTSPQVKFSKGLHEFSIGPNFMLASASTASDKSNPKFTGFQGAYEIYPLEGSKKLNFMFFNEFIANRIVDKWSSQTWNAGSQSYQTYSYKSAEYLVQNHIGYGILWKVHPNINIKQSVGGGIYYSYINNQSDPESAEIPEANVSGYDSFGLSYGFNLSIRIIM
ncbi:MAG: hypothetical protein ACNS60_15140 [Candidatus Cyclobacteriaceae bacterium M2_1C_046]